MKKFVVATVVAIAAVGCGGTGSESGASAPPTEPEIDIWTATSQGAVGILEQHLAYGTDINGTFVLEGIPGSGGTPLHIACLLHQHDAMRLLVENGASIDRKAVYPDPFGGTPLHWATASGNSVAVDALLKAGANVNSTENYGSTPLDAVLFDLQTLSALDPTNLPPNKQRIYSTLVAKGGRHR